MTCISSGSNPKSDVLWCSGARGAAASAARVGRRMNSECLHTCTPSEKGEGRGVDVCLRVNLSPAHLHTFGERRGPRGRRLSESKSFGFGLGSRDLTLAPAHLHTLISRCPGGVSDNLYFSSFFFNIFYHIQSSCILWTLCILF